MNNVITSLIFLFSALGAFSAEANKQKCKSIDKNSYNQLIKSNPDITHIIYYASWCGSCKKHVENATSSDLLVAVHDEPEDAQHVIRSLAPKHECYIGKSNFAEHAGVFSLPFSHDRKEL